MRTPTPASVSPRNTLQPSPYGEFYGDMNAHARDDLFVFVTREGRVMARHADGTITDVTDVCALIPKAAYTSADCAGRRAA